ncbi:MAG: isopentenyl-diphosphate Delta-isomerase [Bacteroidales bacterium]|nr:isopentenyl-diphosphate Delta-isomerase [Bacteroidales bacterium]
MPKEFVIVVDEKDNQIGLMEKMEAHEKGILHRAFSAFVFDDNHELILQQRALSKYHSPGLWTNTCCSHPRNKETAIEAGKRRLIEEMGFSCELNEVLSFIYKSDEVGQGLIEHELDHVLIGRYSGAIEVVAEEVAGYKSMKLEDIEKDILLHPEIYTIWFRIIFKRFMEYVQETNFINR